MLDLGTVQEEIGSRGAKTAAFNINPKTGLAIDMGVAMDFPRARPEDQGRLDLGKGPAITQGANTNPVVFEAASVGRGGRGYTFPNSGAG
ncbi:hypothetical protein [Mesorhizobium sp.]|uniref:hypothetical protein n=1 Tax=Mesorhizobium sp. TaxID=1871066 RepID=UPI0025D4330F|nr:hypothetical protein [Mesorhizobium sp.]